MKHFKPLLLGFGILSLAACKTWDNLAHDISSLDTPSMTETPGDERSEGLLMGGDCPPVEIVHELSALHEFTNPASPSPANMVSQTVISGADSTCSYTGRSVTVDLKLAFDGALGSQGRANKSDKPFFSYPFFVAVTDPSGDILAKEVFAASMTYDSGQDRQTYHEDLRQIIPVPDKEHGSRYKVLVGFQLNQDQLEYNRKVLLQEKAAPTAASPAPVEVQQGGPVINVDGQKFTPTTAPAPAPVSSEPVKISP